MVAVQAAVKTAAAITAAEMVVVARVAAGTVAAGVEVAKGAVMVVVMVDHTHRVHRIH